MQDLIGYDEIIESSMRSVIYETLKKIEKSGLPGNHYFVITFLSRYPKVSMSKSLMEKYPDEMTIAVQYQYRGLEVSQDGFKISLSFGGNYEKLEVPYKAITSFADPSMNFALKFTMTYDDIDNISKDLLKKTSDMKDSDIKVKNIASEVDLTAKVVSLDAFRSKKDDD